MNIKLAKLLLGLLLISPIIASAQRGKDLDYTVTALNTTVNTYTYLTANATAGVNSITVFNNAMGGGAFAGNLAAGDLILIIQMQGASMDINVIPTADWGGNYTVPDAYLWDFNWNQSNTKVAEWGKVTNYNNAGKYEQVEVLSVAGSNTINLSCPLQNSYTSSGHVQIVRVPRFNNLTLNTNTSIVPPLWNGNTGGVVSVEVNGNLVINSNSKLHASGRGFRGGIANNNGTVGSCTPHGNNAGNPGTHKGSTSSSEGARKGEGIGGYEAEYLAVYSPYGCGSPANGGGGGGYQNSGGGGGSNVGVGTYTGKGVPSTTYANGYWNIELAGFAGSVSPGGGRGGYSLSGSDQNALTVGPNQTAWCATASTNDVRKENGGLGGHPLAYDATRLFMGGGGGAGDQDSGQGGSGSAGGGIVFVTCYGTISGSGTIESDGAVGSNSNPNNQTPGFGLKKGNDGAGGGGAGGTIIIKNSNPIPATISLLARGGAGGNHNLSLGFGASSEGAGPGGGGAGGCIVISSGSPTQTVSGGANGTSNSAHLTEFVANGATGGSSGIAGNIISTYDISINDTSICSSASVTLTATVTGTLPGTLTWYSQQFGGASIGTGTTYTTPVLATTTTYYVGVCPGSFREPVTVTINPGPVISGTAVLTNPTCSAAGSITGLTVSGGLPIYTYSWNGTVTPGPDYTNIPAGNYTLTVTDQNGCTDTDGPHTLVGTAGPIIDASAVILSDETCNGTFGSITGITATGTGLTYSWTNGGGNNLDALNLVAGAYTLTVTDGNGCISSTGPYTISFIAGPTIDETGLTIQAAACGNNDGSVTGITASGTSLTYSWTNGGGSAVDATNLAAGDYTLTVTDNNGCIVLSGPHTVLAVSGPTIIETSLLLTDENCGLSNGSITGLSISGGTALFSYAWTNTAQTSLDITNLPAGTYSLTVTDQNGCIANSGPYNLLNTGGPILNTGGVTILDELCNGTLGSITGITASGTGLSYSWSNGGGNNLDATNLVAGPYTLTVTDGNSCTAIAGPYTVNFIAGPTIDISGIVIQDGTCGNNNASITGITASGTSLSYSWTNGGGNNIDATNLAAGDYTITVTDGNSCSASAGPFNLTSGDFPAIDESGITITPESCNQGDGSITGLLIVGGTSAFNYDWTNTAQTTLDITNLSAGSYSLTVTDGAGCIVNAGPFTVASAGGPILDETNVLVTDVLCDGTPGAISGIIASGTGLSYSWTNGGGNAIDAGNLLPGNYILTVTDGNGCIANSVQYTVNAPIPLAIDATNLLISPTACTSNTGSISGLAIVGGINPSPQWDNSATTLDLNNLAAGDYILTVTDDQGCTDNLLVSISMVNAPNIDTNAMVITEENCGQTNGTISGIMVNGGTPTYTYSWNTVPVSNTIDLNNASSGSYTLTVTDNAGCTDTEIISIGETGNPIVDATNLVLTQITCTALGSINGLVVLGSGSYTYNWTGTSQTTLNITDLSAGNYALTVTDIFGCEGNYGPIILNPASGPNANFTWSPGNPDIGENVAFTNTSSGSGITSTVWLIEGQIITDENTNFVFNETGDYSVTLIIQDVNGCMDSLTQIVSVYDEIIIPNVISVNGDNVNEMFEIAGLKPNTSITILNRWGNVVYFSNNYQNNWNGKDNSGADLIEGVYTYLINTPDDKIEHGFVHLMR